jgi:hypothetical protein
MKLFKIKKRRATLAFLCVLFMSALSVSALSAQAAPGALGAEKKVSNDFCVILSANGCAFSPGAYAYVWVENYAFSPFLGGVLRLEDDVRLGDTLISPMVECGTLGSNILLTAGCGLGYVFREEGSRRLDFMLTPFFGDYGYLEDHFFFGARLEAIGRLQIYGWLKALATAGIEWMADSFNLSVGLGFSL